MEDRWLYGWAVGYAAVGAASLLVPLYALSLPGGGPLLVGLLASTAAFAGVPGALLWGKLAARANRRRPFILVALGSVAAVLTVVPFVERAWSLLVVNAALWFVVAAAAPVLNLVIVEGVPERAWEERIARLNAYQGYGWVGGLVVGAVWTTLAPPLLGVDLAQRVLFGVLALTSAAGFFLVYHWYPDPVRISESYFRQTYRDLAQRGWGAGRTLQTALYTPNRMYWGIVSIRRERLQQLRTPLWRYLLAAALFSVGFAVFWGPIPAYLRGPEAFDDGTIFSLFLLANVGSAVFYARVDDLVDRVGSTPAQTAALVSRVVLFPLVGVVGATAFDLPALGACFALIGVTWAVIAVTTTGIVTRLAPAPERGEALGLQAALVGLGTGIGNAVGGLLASRAGFFVTFVVAGGIVLAGALLVVASGDARLSLVE